MEFDRLACVDHHLPCNCYRFFFHGCLIATAQEEPSQPPLSVTVYRYRGIAVLYTGVRHNAMWNSARLYVSVNGIPWRTTPRLSFLQPPRLRIFPAVRYRRAISRVVKPTWGGGLPPAPFLRFLRECAP